MTPDEIRKSLLQDMQFLVGEYTDNLGISAGSMEAMKDCIDAVKKILDVTNHDT